MSAPPLTVIIGNPPCSDSVDVNNEGKIIAKLMNDFRPPKAKGRSNKQKQLANEMSKFLRWSLFKAEKSKPSIFALVLPSTFAQNESFLYARKYLAEHVSEMWVLDFDVDNRAGHNAENLFNTLQGRLLLVGTLRELNFSHPVIHYKGIYKLSKREKIEYFKSDIQFDGWETVLINKKFSFKPTTGIDENLYSQFWHLKAEDEPSVFQRDCSGLKLAPTHLLVHFSKGQLKRRSKYIADFSNSYEQIKERWYKGQMKPPSQKKLTPEVRIALGNSDMRIVDYSYRPFLTARLILDNDLMDALRNTAGGGMRERPEVQAAYEDDGVFGFAVAPAPADICPEIKKFSSFCWNIPDNDLATRGNAHIFCNKFPEYKTGKNWSKKAISNVNTKLVNILAKLMGYTEQELIDKVVYYAYAALNSEFYMKTFEAKLHTVAGDWASIPITSDKNLFDSLVEIGIAMSHLEKKDYKVSDSVISTLFTEDYTRSFSENEMHSYRIESNSITMLDKQNKAIVRIVSDESVLNFEVSGYNVVREWLKYHLYAYYRKSCSANDIRDLINLIGKIYEYQGYVHKDDVVMRKILISKLIKPIR